LTPAGIPWVNPNGGAPYIDARGNQLMKFPMLDKQGIMCMHENQQLFMIPQLDPAFNVMVNPQNG